MSEEAQSGGQGASLGGASELAVARLRQEELSQMANFQRVRADNAEELLRMFIRRKRKQWLKEQKAADKSVCEVLLERGYKTNNVRINMCSTICAGLC